MPKSTKENGSNLIIIEYFLAGWYLMLISAISDLNKRTVPRLDAFHSSDGAGKTGVTYWKKTYMDMDYCEAQNGYVCQRPAAAGSDSFNKGMSARDLDKLNLVKLG